MFELIIFMIHAKVGCTLGSWFVHSHPKFRMDTLVTILFILYGVATIIFLHTGKSFAEDYHSMIGHLFIFGWCGTAVFCLISWDTREPFLVTFRKRAILVSNESYLVGGLIRGRDKPKFVVKRYDTTAVSGNEYDYFFKNGFRHDISYYHIVQDFKDNMPHHSAMLHELNTRKDIHDRIKYTS